MFEHVKHDDDIESARPERIEIRGRFDIPLRDVLAGGVINFNRGDLRKALFPEGAANRAASRAEVEDAAGARHSAKLRERPAVT